MVDSGFTVYVNSRNMLYFSEPSFSLLRKGTFGTLLHKVWRKIK